MERGLKAGLVGLKVAGKLATLMPEGHMKTDLRGRILRAEKRGRMLPRHLADALQAVSTTREAARWSPTSTTTSSKTSRTASWIRVMGTFSVPKHSTNRPTGLALPMA